VDVAVEQPAGATLDGGDPQLEAAVAVLLQRLGG